MQLGIYNKDMAMCLTYLIIICIYLQKYIDKVTHETISGTGKQTHTYIDEPRSGIVEDYFGTPYEYYELSSIHLEGAEYDFSIAQEYIDYVLGVKQEVIE